MRTAKKVLALFLAMLMVFSLAACGKKEPEAKYPERDVDLPAAIPAATEDTIQIHYQREDNKYSGWTLWLWDPAGQDDSKEDDWNYQDDYGVIACYPLSKFGDLSSGKLGIIVKTKGSWTKDGTDADRFIVFSDLVKDGNTYHIYLAGGDENMYKTAEKIITDSIDLAEFADGKTLMLRCSNATEHYTVYENNEVIADGSGAGRYTYSIPLDKEADFAKQYAVEVTFRGTGAKLRADVSTRGLYNTAGFNEKYYYDGELGAIFSKEGTTFRVWSPVSSKIVLKLYQDPTTNQAAEYTMAKKDKGVFEYRLEGDLGCMYYTYKVYNSAYPDGAEIVDPYARSAAADGKRGMVVDPAQADPEGWADVKVPATDRKALTVWEMHVADITSSDTWQGTEANRRKYLGVIEPGTTYTKDGKTVKTGFDHIVELGVNAVQLQPVFDHNNDEHSYSFNWGYDPLNYNVPEGLFSSDPDNGYVRIRELKQLIAAFNNKGISVIMDMVYNHVSSAKGSNFDVLMPGYYFRYKADGTLSNGSGCGNETASEMPMMRKFIIDSTCYWAKEYKLRGFRFDLMGLHDIETMNMVVDALKKIDPNIVVYGEPWTGGATPLAADSQAVQANGNKFAGYGQFNDQMRDALIKGGLNSADALGWVTGTAATKPELDAIAAGINGITASTAVKIEDADKTVNYVTCHDNYTLYDRIKAAGITDEDTIRKMCVLANSVVFTSKGTSFMLAGEEMLRTKGGDSNSYKSPDSVNAIDYSLLIRNADIYEAYKALIAFKQNTAALAENAGGIDVSFQSSGTIISKFSSQGKDHMVICANGSGGSQIATEGYTVVLDTLGKIDGSHASVTPEKYQTLILIK